MSSSLQFIYAELARSMLGGHPGTSQPAPPPGLDWFAARRVRTPRGFTMPAGRRCATALESTRSGLAGRCPPRPDLQKWVGGGLLKITSVGRTGNREWREWREWRGRQELSRTGRDPEQAPKQEPCQLQQFFLEGSAGNARFTTYGRSNSL